MQNVNELSPTSQRKANERVQRNIICTSAPRHYSGARSGVLTHVSCKVDAKQIEAAQSEALKNSTEGLSCIECGLPFLNLQALRKHAQNKTVWTDRGLLGCRISVMWAHNNWYEGVVTQFDSFSPVAAAPCSTRSDDETSFRPPWETTRHPATCQRP